MTEPIIEPARAGKGGRPPSVDDATLGAMSDAVCRMGALMLSAGTGSYRVKSAMGRVAHALGIEQLDAEVSLNEIVVTTRVRKRFRTQVVEVGVPAVNADRISALLRVSLRARSGLRAEDLQRQLDRVESRPHLYPAAVVVLGAALACAAFAFLNNGRWQECLAAGLAAALGKFVQLKLRGLRLNQLAIVGIAATVAALAYLLAADLLRRALPFGDPLHEAAFTSAMLFLIPGFPLVTAALDLARFDFVSGMSRLLYTVLITMAASLGGWVVATGFGLTPSEIMPLSLPAGALVAFRAAASFVGVLGFALTFNTPLRVALAASGIGMIANLARLASLDAGWNALLCTLAATMLVGLLSGWVSQRILAPRIILSVPAVLIMVPGTTTFRALVAMINHDPLNALTNAISSVSLLVALAGGLAVARMFTDPAWIAPSPSWTHLPHTRAQRVLRERARSTPPDR